MSAAAAIIELAKASPARSPLDDWSGEIGDEYFRRNPITHDSLYTREMWLRRVMAHIGVKPKTFLEVGSGPGANLQALRRILPQAVLAATEPNKHARELLTEAMPTVTVGVDPAQNLTYADGMFDFVFTNGCLIHIPPDELHLALDEIYRVSTRWILLCEYFAAKREHVPWRGSHFWKCDFGAEMLNRHPTLEAAACNFEWKHLTGMDHATWWLFLKPVEGK